MPSNFEFHQQLLQEYLLESGKISAEQLTISINSFKEYRASILKNDQSLTYIVDQYKYKLSIISPWTGEIIKEIFIPQDKKHPPKFLSVDWFATGNSNVLLFDSKNCRQLGQISWEPSSEQHGLTISENYSHLFFGGIDNHPYLALMNTLLYEAIPSEPLNCLPLDLTVSPDYKTMLISDRGSGSIYIFDIINQKLVGSLIIRQPGNKKILSSAIFSNKSRLYISDFQSSALFVVNTKKLVIKRQPLPYGILTNILLSPDESWLYALVIKQDQSSEIVVLDSQNFLLKTSIKLEGELFSFLDDPCDLMVISPDGKTLLVMTYVNTPALFTPVINVIDLESYEIIDNIYLSDENKPTFLAFAVPKPEKYYKFGVTLIDILIDKGFITKEEIKQAEKILMDSFEKKEVTETTLKQSPEEDYPVLNQFQIDPNLLIIFKEEQLRYFKFLPLNKLDNKLTIASVNPNDPELNRILNQNFPDLPKEIVKFSEDEFNRFMEEFYKVIMEKYLSILSRLSNRTYQTVPDKEKTFQSVEMNVPPPKNLYKESVLSIEQKEVNNKEEIIDEKNKIEEIEKESTEKINQDEVSEEKSKIIQVKSTKPEDTKSDVVVKESTKSRIKYNLNELEPEIIEKYIAKYCCLEFKKIWGIDVPINKELFNKIKPMVTRARQELNIFDYTIIKIEEFYKNFSLETVLTYEKLTKILRNEFKKLQKSNQKKYKCIKCGKNVSKGIELCSDCSQKELEKENFSVTTKTSIGNLPENHYLTIDYENGRVIEIQNKPQAQIIWQAGGKDNPLTLNDPQSAIRLANGNTLIAETGSDKVIEISKSWRIHWELKPDEKHSDILLKRPVKALRFLNGNTLVVDQGNHRVFEVNNRNKIVWQYGITNTVGITNGRLYSPSDCQRLENKHNLITDTDNHRIIELNEEDKIIWQYGNEENKLGSGYGEGRNQLNSPQEATRLNNGNTLIVDSGNYRVIEVNPDKKIVWYYSTNDEEGNVPISFTPLKAIRLENNNTIIFGPHQMLEISYTGKLLNLIVFSLLQKSRELITLEQFPSITLSTEPSKEHIMELAKKVATSYIKTNVELIDIDIIVTARNLNKIFIVNRKKQIVWRYGEVKEHSIHKLERPNSSEMNKEGYILIADTDRHRVIEVFRQTKEIVWQYGITDAMGSGVNQLGHPRSATWTNENTILITDQYSGKVIEVDKDSKEIVWSFGGWDTGVNPLNGPYYAIRTEAGTTLITDWSNHIVIEVNYEGEIIWKYGITKNPGSEYKQLMYPERAVRLPNGNTLITDTRNNRILEVDPEGNIVWQFGGKIKKGNIKQLSNPTVAYRLQNDNTIIIHNSNRQILEVTLNNEIVWEYNLPLDKKYGI